MDELIGAMIVEAVVCLPRSSDSRAFGGYSTGDNLVRRLSSSPSPLVTSPFRLYRFIRVRWRQARGYMETWAAEYDH